jgi:hypothetical protein
MTWEEEFQEKCKLLILRRIFIDIETLTRKNTGRKWLICKLNLPISFAETGELFCMLSFLIPSWLNGRNLCHSLQPPAVHVAITNASEDPAPEAFWNGL